MPRSQKTDLDVVLEVLADAESYPADGHTVASRGCLIAGLPHALARRPGEEAHKFQKGLVGLAEAALAAARATAAKALAAAEQEAKAAEEREDQAQVAACEAAEAVPARQAEREAKAAALPEIEAEVAAAEKYFRGLEEAKDAVLAERAVVKGRKEAADAAAVALEKLRTEEDVQDTDVARVVDYLREVDAEEALMAAGPHVLATRPSERREFDNSVLEEVGRVLAQTSAEAAERLAEGADGEAYAEAEALGAWAILDLAHEKKENARYAANVAKRAVKSAEDGEVAAKAAVESCRAEMSASLVQQTLAEARIKEVDAALAALARCVQAPAVEATVEMAPPVEDVSMSLAVGEADCIPTDMKVDAVDTHEIADLARSGA